MTELIDGIEVLNVTEAMESPGWAVICMVLGIIGGLISVMALMGLETLSAVGRACCLVCSIICFAMFIIGGIRTEKPNIHTGIYTYQVVIDDTVPATYLYDNFEILKQEGKIWTIKEKKR